MNKIILSPQFEKSYNKFVKRLPFLQIKIDESIKLLEENIYDQDYKLINFLENYLEVWLAIADMIAE